MNFELPKEKAYPTNIKENKYYVVDVALTKDNPIHRSILYSGFINKGKLEGYAKIFNGTYFEEFIHPSKYYYIKIVEEIKSMGTDCLG